MAYCIHCGKQLIEGARFCAFCGQSTSGTLARQGQENYNDVHDAVSVSNDMKKQVSDTDKIIDYLRKSLGLDAEAAEDGGVRVTSRLKKDGKYLLDQLLETINTPDGRKLKGIRLPEGITEIGERAFYGAWDLQYIELPDTLKKIDRSAFALCHLEEIKIPENVTHIGSMAFSCTHLLSVQLPENLKKLGDSIFAGCGELTEVVLPDNLSEIGGCAFSECRVLKNVKIPDSVQRIGSCAFSNCKSLKEIKIPAGVKCIEEYTFDGCAELSQVDFASDAEIKKDAFRGCKKVDANGRPKINQKDVCPAKLPADFDANKLIAHLRNNFGLKAEKAEDGGVRIAGLLYSEDNEALELRRAVKPVFTMSDRRMDGIILPEGVTEIADEAFKAADCLHYISLPSTLRVIGEAAFEEAGLLEIVIPESVKEIGVAAFLNCLNLQKATFECPIKVLPSEIFLGCEELEEVILPNTLEVIEDEAFEQCSKLSKLHLPAQLKRVSPNAFCECPVDAIR